MQETCSALAMTVWNVCSPHIHVGSKTTANSSGLWTYADLEVYCLSQKVLDNTHGVAVDKLPLLGGAEQTDTTSLLWFKKERLGLSPEHSAAHTPFHRSFIRSWEI